MLHLPAPVLHPPAPLIAAPSALDFHRIGPKLYQGSFPAPGDAVYAAGFDVLVLCAQEKQPAGWQYPGVLVVHSGFDDTPHPTRQLWETAIAAAHTVAERIVRGERCLVTCRAGLNRSGLVSALALRRLTGQSGAVCRRQVQMCRPGALFNQAFAAFLDQVPPRQRPRLVPAR